MSYTITCNTKVGSLSPMFVLGWRSDQRENR